MGMVRTIFLLRSAAQEFDSSGVQVFTPSSSTKRKINKQKQNKLSELIAHVSRNTAASKTFQLRTICLQPPKSQIGRKNNYLSYLPSQECAVFASLPPASQNLMVGNRKNAMLGVVMKR